MATPTGKTDAEKVRDGLNAAAILSDPFSIALWQELEAELIAGWKSTNPMQAAEREAIWAQYQGLLAVKRRLETLASVGRDADGKIQRKAKDAPGIPSHYRLT